ncbi:KICSTOR complex protein C12orf66 [Aplysia californica]|uniref:KICSTOR complex protein C12orf66 n=1 Tax=Aplysia californica TaxID=6500 RepID=A0ABM1AAS3_APLCA|nr:KICSTOR complex protein C12orf66 [Aplysia californica]
MDAKKSKPSGKWALIDPSTTDLAMRMSSQESVTTQLSTSTIPHEESVLELYFYLLSQTNFDKAKDLVDTEKDGHKFSVVPTWGEILQCLSQLATAERNYANLVFLGQKRFTHIVRTKDSAKSIYAMLLQEFQRMENMLTPLGRSSSHSSDASGGMMTQQEMEQLLAHISGQLYFFIFARIKMIDFYEQLMSLGTTRHWVNFEDLFMMCEEILKEHIKGFHHPLLVPVKTMFGLEVESLCHLLHAQIQMCQWNYLPCVLQLQQGHSKLNDWMAMIPSKEVKTTFGRTSSKSCPYPPLLNWMLKFKGILLSKFGLYFHDILFRQTVPPELKMNQSRTPEDFVGRIQTFQRKFDANIYLILDTHGLGPRAGEGGYHHPDKYAPPPQGLDTYPPIFSCPLERAVNSTHWPNICMMITSSPEAGGDKPKFFYDRATEKRPHSSYFIMRVDTRVSMVVVFETKKSEKDSGINGFMTEMAAQLRCQTIMAALKSFAKS